MSAHTSDVQSRDPQSDHDSAEHHAARSTGQDAAPKHAVKQARAEERHGEQAQRRRLHDDES